MAFAWFRFGSVGFFSGLLPQLVSTCFEVFFTLKISIGICVCLVWLLGIGLLHCELSTETRTHTYESCALYVYLWRCNLSFWIALNGLCGISSSSLTHLNAESEREMAAVEKRTFQCLNLLGHEWTSIGYWILLTPFGWHSEKCLRRCVWRIWIFAEINIKWTLAKTRKKCNGYALGARLLCTVQSVHFERVPILDADVNDSTSLC